MTTRLVVCDIDNTLVPKHKGLTPRTREAILKLREKGILFGLASGRNVTMLRNLEEQWGIRSDMLIGWNGSELYDGLDDLEESYYRMEPEWIRECVELMAPFDCNPSVFRDNKAYSREISAAVKASSSYMKNSYPAIEVKDDSEFWAGPAPKIGFRVSAEDMPAIEATFAAHPSPYWKGFKTETTMWECCNAKASKGDILKKFCDRHHIPLADTMAFGDMTNDISMLVTAGVGVCMASGSDDTKAAADLITDLGVEEDGWADFVEKHLLG